MSLPSDDGSGGHLGLTKKNVLNMLVDENVDYVVKELNHYMDENKEQIDFCVCSRCLLDIVALTLNGSPSHYRLLGRHAHKELEHVKRIHQEIRVSLEKAVPLVQKRPHHES